MKSLVLAAALILPAACATTTSDITQLVTIERPAPINTVQVTVGDRVVPVKNATIPLHYSLEQPQSPAREHIRQLLLNAAI